MLGTRRQHEEALDARLFRAALDTLHQLLAVTPFAVLGADRQAGELGIIIRMTIEGRATDNDAVVLDDGKMFDLALEEFTRPVYQGPFRLQRLDQGGCVPAARA